MDTIYSRAIPSRAVVGAILLVLAAVDGARAADRPNIVFVMADDAGYNEFGYTAALNGLTTPFQTPNIDALASQSRVLTNAYVSSPLCSPSRAAILTGQYQSRFGYENNIGYEVGNADYGLLGEQELVSEHLKTLGYTTGAIGKWHVGAVDGYNNPQDQGFDEFYGFLGGDRSYWNRQVTAIEALRRGRDSIEGVWASEGNAANYDTQRGRYLTDAFGEEAVDFIDRHANDDNPFFLYVPLTGPHLPMEAKQDDLALFSSVSDERQRHFAAMNYAVDRAVGNIVDALAANDIDDNTILVFTNDNGGAGGHLNDPFQGRKGYLYEGGIRVPTLVRAPGVGEGVFDAAVTLRDFAPTFVSAAGGDLSQYDFDGKDILPHLAAGSSQVHDRLFWRAVTGAFAVRTGNLKLTSPSGEVAGAYFLYDVENDPGETTDLKHQYPELVAELLIDLGYWEAEQQRPLWGTFGAELSTFDHFTINPNFSNEIYWSQSDRWFDPEGNAVTMRRQDGYANTILEFVTSDTKNYSTRNSAGRLTRQDFMLNEIRLTGEHTSSSSHRARLNGEPLLMVASLDGTLPTIRLDATGAAGAAKFVFEVHQEVKLMADLEITGDGTQTFEFTLPITDFDPAAPRSVTKTGTSTVSLKRNNSFGGALNVLEGEVRLDGDDSEIVNSLVMIAQDGRLRQSKGMVVTDQFDNSHGGTHELIGGSLAFGEALGDLNNQSGEVSPHRAIGAALIDGDYTQGSTGVLRIDLGQSASDLLVVSGVASIAGTLDVNLDLGFSPTPGVFLPVVFAESLNADALTLSADDQGVFELVAFQGDSLYLRTLGGLDGDYNRDGVVDAADYTVWRDALAMEVPRFAGADGDGDGVVGHGDYAVWRANFGASLAESLPSAAPEPAAITLLIAAAGAWRRRRLV